MSEKNRLSVNLNKIATLRNARGGDNPNVLAFARLILEAGAHGLTVHPRPDERHIRRQDVFELADFIRNWNQKHSTQIEFNIEGYPSEDFLGLLKEVRPEQATLVPDPPHVITSNAGWDLAEQEDFLISVTQRIRSLGSRVSLFVEPETWTTAQGDALRQIQPDRAELYTELYAVSYGTPQEDAVTALYRSVATEILNVGVQLNAGHDLNQQNLGHLIDQIPEIYEVSIGHALISEALVEGMAPTVKSYLRILKSAGTI